MKDLTGALRVVTWNVARFIEIKKNNNTGSQIRSKMMEVAEPEDADILCLQEFHFVTRLSYYDNISYITKKLHYPYYYFSFDEDGQSNIIVPLFFQGTNY